MSVQPFRPFYGLGSGDVAGRNLIYKTGVEKEMPLQEIIDILAYPDLSKVSNMPAIKPKGGDVYLYRCPDYDSRHDIRADQYVWCQQGTKKIPKEDPVVKRFYMYIRTEAPIRNIYSKRPKKTFAKYDVRFMKVEYELIDAEDPLVLVHYIGDESVWKPFRHGNSVRNDRPFVRTMKSAVKRRILEMGPVAPPKEIFKAMVTTATVAPGYEAVAAPRNKEQVRNYLKFANMNRLRSSGGSRLLPFVKRPMQHDQLDPMDTDEADSASGTPPARPDTAYDSGIGGGALPTDPYDDGCADVVDDDEVILNGLDPHAKFYPLFPTFEMCHNGRLKGFVNSMLLVPQCAVTLANKNVLNVVNELAQLDAANKIERLEFYYVSGGPVAGGYYLSTLLFRHCLFESEPVVPAAYLVHERRNANDHQLLFEMVKAKCPELSSTDCVFITDREYSSIRSVLPSAIHLYSWNYFDDEVVNWVENNGGTTADSNRFVADVRALLKSKNVEKFNRELANRRRHWPPSFVNFFDRFLKNDILSKGARWHSAGLSGAVYDPHVGVSIPPCKDLNELVGALVEWPEATLEQLIQCLYYFSEYYAHEIEQGIHQVGSWKLRARYSQYGKTVTTDRFQLVAPFELGHTNNIVNHVRMLAAAEREQEQESVVMTEAI